MLAYIRSHPDNPGGSDEDRPAGLPADVSANDLDRRRFGESFTDREVPLRITVGSKTYELKGGELVEA